MALATGAADAWRHHHVYPDRASIYPHDTQIVRKAQRRESLRTVSRYLREHNAHEALGIGFSTRALRRADGPNVLGRFERIVRSGERTTTARKPAALNADDTLVIAKRIGHLASVLVTDQTAYVAALRTMKRDRRTRGANVEKSNSVGLKSILRKPREKWLSNLFGSKKQVAQADAWMDPY
jgi:hypothetical protein